MPNLQNAHPIDPSDPANRTWLERLQGNILNGHGRDHTVHLFIRLPGDAKEARPLIKELAAFVTSALRQENERVQFHAFGIPGRMFGNLFLSANGYRKLGFDEADLQAKFVETPDEPRATASNFLDGMASHAAADLGDPEPSTWDPGFNAGDIDAMLLLADDDEGFLAREARRIIDTIENRCDIVRIERGTALRTDEGEGIEHFGYVDGRSQPLYLASDFVGLSNGKLGPGTQGQRMKSR